MVKKKEEKISTKKKCLECEIERKLTDFYKHDSKIYKDNKYPICKTCIKSKLKLDNPISDIAIESVKNVMLEMNKPFIYHLWISSIEEARKTGKKDIFGLYKKNVDQNNATATWKNSEFEKINENKQYTNDENYLSVEEDIFKVTHDLIKKWGKFEPEDYYKLEDFYTKMMISNKIETPQEETYLKKLAVISLKMDKELEEGNYGQVKQLGDLFSKYMADSKFRAMDQTDASKTGGLRTFSQIYAEVEKDEFIPPWEEYRKIKGLEQDIVDKTIMHILNYTLKLNKAPQLTIPPEDTPKIEED